MTGLRRSTGPWPSLRNGCAVRGTGARRPGTGPNGAEPEWPDEAPWAGAGPEDADLPDEAGVVPIQMEGDGPVVVREKFHAAKPVSVDQALFEMELVGHDFYLFRDERCGLPSVVYRRHGYQYGLIRLVEQPQPDAAANGGRPV